ncbi:MAG: allantoinase AllB [Saprospiraceae bacterium]|nr:allantoinase AllB [Saprospiraceae bacterium]
MLRDLAIHSRRCWIEGAFIDATLEMRNGRIAGIHPGRFGTPSLLDVGDAVVMPGVVDIHVHINEPGRTEWEGFDTATRAAALGGTTTVIDMPLNSSPVTTTRDSLKRKLDAADGQLHVHCGFWAGAVGQSATQLATTLDAGCLGAKAFLIDSGIDEFPSVGRAELATAMEVLVRHGLPLLTHAEVELPVAPAGTVERSLYTTYLATRPPAWEVAAIRLLIELCRTYRCRTHVVHLSAAEALDDIAAARAEGLPLTVETCPHYLHFCAEDIPDGRTEFKCAPPIRDQANQAKLKQAVRDGLIDLLATDHSPAPPSLKEMDSGNLIDAWGGIAGIQYLLSAGWTALRDTVTLEAFIPLVTSRPARLAGLHHAKGTLSPGSDADICIWDPNLSYVPTATTAAFRHKISPYFGQSLHGQVIHTFVAGQHVVRHGALIASGAGQPVLGSN